MKDELVDLAKERELNSRIQNLESEEEMLNDLWPSIKQQISSSQTNVICQSQLAETRNYTASWIPWAIAASLIVSIGSMTFSWNKLKQVENIYAQISQEQKSDLTVEGNLASVKREKEDLVRQVDLMEQEYKLARVDLMSKISMNARQIDKATLKDIRETLKEIESANQLLKKAIIETPDDHRLVTLLKTTYQQELNVLTQLVKLDTSI